MAKRRGNGEGSIYLRSDGRWVASVDLGYRAGKRRRRVVYGRTRKEVAEKLKGLHRQQQEGTLQAASKLTVGGHLLDWLEGAKARRRATTIEVYTRIINTHIIPRIGRVRIQQLTPDDIDAMVAAIIAEGHTPTAQQARLILNRALKDGIRRKKLTYNPVAATEPPSHTPRPAYELTDDEARRLHAACTGDRLGIAVLLGLQLGLPRGEITGLKWLDIDWEAQTITIQRTGRRVGKERATTPLKTKNSVRTLPLTSDLIAALKTHQEAQLEELALKGLTNDGNFILVSQNATMYDTANYLHAFRQILGRAELPGTIRPHDLRHSCARHRPAHRGKHLGHASAKLTLDIYARAQGRIKERRDAIEAMRVVLTKREH